MVVYEVNLMVAEDLIETYLPWLKQHIEEMLTFEGFEGADLLCEARTSNAGSQSFVVHYRLRRISDLERYFEEDAERMRGEGLTRFPSGVRASRRILTQV